MDNKTLELIEAYGIEQYADGMADESRSGAPYGDPAAAKQALIDHLTAREWQDISTAPLRKRVLVYQHGYVEIASCDDKAGMRLWFTENEKLCRPQGWKYLDEPAAPAQASAGDVPTASMDEAVEIAAIAFRSSLLDPSKTTWIPADDDLDSQCMDGVFDLLEAMKAALTAMATRL